jgi:RHS repeat-associated protein
MNIHPIITPASPSLASPIFDASFDSIESLTTTFTSPVVPTLETTTVTEVALGYHRNQQYSITAMTTSTGAVAERYAYTAYGQPTILNASGTVLTSSAVGNRYTYTGREWDETLGLHHFRARWMSPLAGRFLGRDPIRFLNALSPFYDLFGLASTDPSGQVEIKPMGRTSTECGTKISYFDFYLGKIAPCEGYFVQQVEVWCESEVCPCKRDNYKFPMKTPNSPAWTYWEFWPVKKNEVVSYKRPGGYTDGFGLGGAASVNYRCGYFAIRGTLKFFCKNAAEVPLNVSPKPDAIGTGDLENFRPVSSPVCGGRNSGTGKGTDNPNDVPFWSSIPIEGPSAHWSKRSWQCCNSCNPNEDEAKDFPSPNGAPQPW